MSSPTLSSCASTRPAWDIAVAEIADRPGLRARLARPASDLRLRFGETYAQLTALPRAQRRRLQRRLGVGLAGAALLLALGLAPVPALAGTITVDGTTCTLADAITAANSGTDTGGCTGGSAGADTIDLQTDVSLTSALPDLASAITLQGNGHTIQRTGGPAFSLLKVTSGANLILNQATISGGSAASGGGILLDYGGLTMSGSTLSGNSATNGGGLYSFHGTVIVRNSTLSGNSATNGGGIGTADYAMLIVQNSTLSGNSATNGGGLWNSTSNVLVRNSIVALQTAGADCVVESGSPPITSQGYNIESGTSCGFTGTSNQQNVSSTDLKLYTLTDNGGPTQTHGLAAGSVAIDQIPAASCLGLTTDQRGLTRPVAYNGGDANCDVGAFELQSGGNPPNAVTLRGLAATGALPGGALAGLAAALALGLGGLAFRRRGLEAGAGDTVIPAKAGIQMLEAGANIERAGRLPPQA